MKRFVLALLLALVPTAGFAQPDWGTFTDGGTLPFYTNTVGTDGVAETIVSEDVVVIKDGTTVITVGVTIDDDQSLDFGGGAAAKTGLHKIAIDTTQTGYDTGSIYAIVYKAGTVDSINVANRVIGTFKLGVVQTGDSYPIVSSGTHGNAALKTLIDTLDDYVDTEVASISGVVSSGTHGLAALKTLIDAIDDLIDTEMGDVRTRTLLSLPSVGPGVQNGLPQLDANLNVQVDIEAINDDTSAPANLEAAYDGTGYAGQFSATERAQILAALSIDEETGVHTAQSWVIKRIDGQMKAVAPVAKDAGETLDVLADFRAALSPGDAIKAEADGGIVDIELIDDTGTETITCSAATTTSDAEVWMNSAIRFEISGGTIGDTDRFRVKVLTVGGQTLSAPCTAIVTGAQ